MYERVKKRLPTIPLDGTWHAWHASKAQRDIENDKRAAQRIVSKAIRAQIAEWKIAVSYNPKKHGVPNLYNYLQTEMDHAGRAFIPAVIESKNLREISDRWSSNKNYYPYFTEFIRNMLYMAFYAMTKPNAVLDLNAQADLNIMAHLQHGDILVSNEQGFMRTAFLDLWKPRGKVLMTSNEFFDYLKKL